MFGPAPEGCDESTLLPAVPVIILVLAFNFLGDGLRDAADPYK